ncbi:phosphatidylinositol glycan, class M [Cryptococcus neoformans Bt85]|nr:phosphatidylinositol glycan, class M [Cryptococcus neoformans var. grubii Bt85]
MLRAKTSQIILLSLALHLALILYADHVDSHPERYGGLRYTDVDWRVVTDAARLIFTPTENEQAKGWLVKKVGLPIGDPYDRATFRYTPLLPLFLSPALIHPLLGKSLLALPSLLVPLLLLTGPDPAPFWPTHLLWTINPFVLSITTRGSPEAAICFLVIALHYCLRLGSENKTKGAGETRAAIMLALAVSWKIYPAIYIPAIWKELSTRWGWLGVRVWRFGFIAASSFILINGALWSIWGQPFLDHTYLYHLSRLDHRHNFSPYFYPIYLSFFPSPTASPLPSALVAVIRHPLTSFLPQLSLIVTTSLSTCSLSFAMFLQTALFVAFNKVCTSQYFTWFLPLLPPVIPQLHLSRRETATVVVAWILAQAVWLGSAYMLELRAQSVYIVVWAAGLLVFGVSIYLLGNIIDGWEPARTSKSKLE